MPTKPYGPENLKKLRNIVKLKQHSQLSFARGGKARVDMFTANALLTVYNAVEVPGKEKFVRMLETKPLFGKLIDFVWRQVK